MKLRKRKKAYDCAHHVYKDVFVTDDPYPIHNTEDYCKLGKYDNTWTPPAASLALWQHGVDGQTAASVADVGDNVVAVHHVVLLWAGAACQVELVFIAAGCF